MPDRPAFVRYAERFRARPKYLESKDIDRKLIKAARAG
jgi:hypothetical protein